MSVHSPEKHLAVLEAVFEQDCSVREAARLHGVDRNSVQAWTAKHRRGVETLEMLRARGIVATSAVSSLAEVKGELPKSNVSITDDEVINWRKRGDDMRDELLQERERLVTRIEEIDEALAALD